MRRGAATGINTIMTIVIAIVGFFIVTNIYGMVFEGARDDIDMLNSCDGGLLGSIGGGEGKCLMNPSCEGANPSEGMEWQYIGKGKGCPVNQNSCCIEVPSTGLIGGTEWVGVAEQAKIHCETRPPGIIAIELTGSEGTGCQEDTKVDSTQLDPSKTFTIRYYKYEASPSSCKGDVKISYSGKETEEIPSLGCTSGEEYYSTTLPAPYDYLPSGEDKALLNDGGKLTITIKEGDKHTSTTTFTIKPPEKGYCSEDSGNQCSGKQEGLYDTIGDCVLLENNKCVSATNMKCDKVQVGSIIHYSGSPFPGPACVGVDIAKQSKNLMCSVTDDDGLFVCTLIDAHIGECSNEEKSIQEVAALDIPECIK